MTTVQIEIARLTLQPQFDWLHEFEKILLCLDKSCDSFEAAIALLDSSTMTFQLASKSRVWTCFNGPFLTSCLVPLLWPTILLTNAEPWTVLQPLTIRTASFSALGRFRRFLTTVPLQRSTRRGDTLHVANPYTGCQPTLRDVIIIERPSKSLTGRFGHRELINTHRQQPSNKRDVDPSAA